MVVVDRGGCLAVADMLLNRIVSQGTLHCSRRPGTFLASFTSLQMIDFSDLNKMSLQRRLYLTISYHP